MFQRTSKKKSTVPPPPLLSSRPSLFTIRITHTREEEEDDDNNKAPLLRVLEKTPKNKIAKWTRGAYKNSTARWSLFLSNLIVVHTFRSPFDVDAFFFFFFSACKQHDQRQNGPIRERLRIGTRPKLRQRRDWETDIESARAAGRDADVYFREHR